MQMVPTQKDDLFFQCGGRIHAASPTRVAPAEQNGFPPMWLPSRAQGLQPESKRNSLPKKTFRSVLRLQSARACENFPP